MYVVVTRLDWEIRDQIDELEREARQMTGAISWSHAEMRMDFLRKQDLKSKREPLSEAEIQSLERMGSTKWSELGADERREMRSLASRKPISSAASAKVARMKELRT